MPLLPTSFQQTPESMPIKRRGGPTRESAELSVSPTRKSKRPRLGGTMGTPNNIHTLSSAALLSTDEALDREQSTAQASQRAIPLSTTSTSRPTSPSRSVNREARRGPQPRGRQAHRGHRTVNRDKPTSSKNHHARDQSMHGTTSKSG